jgi:Fe-S-cluster-containing hydrogenase component 2
MSTNHIVPTMNCQPMFCGRFAPSNAISGQKEAVAAKYSIASRVEACTVVSSNDALTASSKVMANSDHREGATNVVPRKRERRATMHNAPSESKRIVVIEETLSTKWSLGSEKRTRL